MRMKRTPLGLAMVLLLLVPWTAPEAQTRREPARTAVKQRPPKARKKAAKKATTKAVRPRTRAASGRDKGKQRKDSPPPPSVAEPAPAVVVPPVEPEAPVASPENEQLASPAEPVERPWARGVSPENQKAAQELFRAGNVRLKESVFLEAIGKYREALALWDHPAIHYNLALALLNLDQPLEVREHLEAAMRYGVAPLDAEKLEHARAYKNLVEKQLARVEVSCDVPGASVVMDGRPLFTAPGRFEGWVRAGPHTLVATREGYLPNNLSRSLPAGETTRIELQLFTAEDLTQYRRRWSAWKPWAVVGAGVAVAAGGGLLHAQARESYREFDAGVMACGGCVPDAGLADNRSRGDTLQTLAIGGYAVGGAALVTGVVLVYMNRLQPYQVDTPGAPPPEQSITVAPVVGGGTQGVWATFRF